MDGVVSVFDMKEGKKLHTIEGHALAVRSIAFSPDSSFLLTASDDMHVKQYEV
jgi:WD repeat-containing protein 61